MRIIETIEQFMVSVPTADGMENFDDLQTYSHSAERWLVSKVLGTELYADIIESIDSSSGPDDTLLTICRNIIANHAYYHAVPFLDVQHTEAGFGVIQSNNKTPASKERIERLRAACMARRDEEIDALIEYLEANSQYHEAWKGSEEFSNLFNSLLPTLTIFRKYHHIADRDTLDKMQSSIITAQNTTVAAVISQDYMDELVEAQKDSDFTAADNAILDRLRHAVCLLALADSIHDMSVVIDAGGMVRSANTQAYNFANETRLQSYSQHFEKRGKELLEKVQNTITTNITSYTVYAASSEYGALTADGFENEEDNEIFSSLH